MLKNKRRLQSRPSKGADEASLNKNLGGGKAGKLVKPSGGGSLISVDLLGSLLNDSIGSTTGKDKQIGGWGRTPGVSGEPEREEIVSFNW